MSENRNVQNFLITHIKISITLLGDAMTHSRQVYI